MAKSALGQIVPLIIAFILLAIITAVGFVAYSIACDVADKTSKKMEKKNISVSRDGLKVGVKELSAEQVGDSTQRYTVFQRYASLKLMRNKCSCKSLESVKLACI